MLNIARVLCPVDFSDASRHALEQAVVIRGFFDARLTVLHVSNQMYLPVPGLAMPSYGGELAGGAEEQARLQQETERFASAAGASGASVGVVVESGAPVLQILARAEKEAVDLIVLGTHGTAGFEHLMLGSVTEKVLRKARCPVLTVPPRAAATPVAPFKHILCAVDFSGSSLNGLTAALALAQEADAELTILHVLDWPIQDTPPASVTVGDVSSAAPVFDLEGYRRVLESDAQQKLAALVPADAREWCTPATRVVHGKPHAEVLRAAAAVRADLIVLGVRGRNPLDLLLFGSTTNQVVRQAGCPVLTVHH